MPDHAEANSLSTRKEAMQALGVMTAALIVGTMVWQNGPSAVLWVFSFCILLMTLVSTTLFVIERTVTGDKPNRFLGFCRPAVGVLGFSAALFAVGGFLFWASLAFLFALSLSAYRRHATAGKFNLIPEAALELGLVGGIGVSMAGVFLVIVNALVAW